MMFRKLSIFFGGAILILVAAGPAAAQGWPPYYGDPLQRGPGNYLAWYKLLLCWLVFFAWVRTTDWVNQDTLELGENIDMPSDVWNPIVVFSGFVGLLLAITIPIFAIGYTLLVVSYVAPLTTYILLRNRRVTGEQKVLTPAHLKRWLVGLATGRKKKQHDTLSALESGPPVKITACGGTDTENQGNLIIARQSPGFVLVKELIADALDRDAIRLMLDFTKEAVGARYDIDGIWHNAEPREREAGDVMLAVMKKISALNMEERRAKQEGSFRIKYGDKKYTCELVSQGTKTGERAIVEFVLDKSPYKTLDDLGMRDKMRDEVKEVLAQESGLVMLSTLPGAGLQTMWNAAITATDRYLRDFLGIEDKNKPWTHVENVEIFTFDSAAGETPAVILKKVLLREPDTVVVPDLDTAETINTLTNHVLEQKKLVIAAIRARDAIEAIMRTLAMKADAELYAQALTAVLSQRLVRKLCETCRQAYEPPPQLLKKLNIPEGRVEVLFREFQPPPPGSKKCKGQPEVCPDCGGLGYKGRIGIFELVKVSDAMRAAMVQRPQLELLRKLSREAGNRSLQEEGILLVARGVTSLNELQRALK